MVKNEATHLIYNNRPEGEFQEHTHCGNCAFCGYHGDVVDEEDIVKPSYFTEHDLKVVETGEICVACAYCMSNKPLKNGHWIATPDEYRRISTSDLLDNIQNIIQNKIEIPFSFHFSSNPILSEHAYLYTPVSYSTSEIVLDYDGTDITIGSEEFESLLDAVEVLRYNGFRLDDIRSGVPRVYNLEQIGVENYKRIDDFLSGYRDTQVLEVVITASRSKSDQPHDSEDIENIITNNKW